MFYRKLTLILFTLLLITLPFLKGKADPVATNNTEAALAYAAFVYNSADDEMDKKWRALDKLEIEYAMLGVEWRANNQEMLKNAIDLGNAVSVDALGSAAAVVTAMSKQMIDIDDAYSLSVKMVNKAIEVEAQNVVVATAVAEQGRAHAHYTAHYKAYSKKYSSSKKFIKRGATPGSVAVGNPSVKCKNTKCTTVYQASVWGLKNIISLSEGASHGSHKGHLVTCSEKKHSKWDSSPKWLGGQKERIIPHPDPYWNCPNDPNNCPKASYHNFPCGGGCGTLFPNFSAQIEAHPHRVDCKEKIKRSFRNLFAGNVLTGECGGYYFSCTQTSADCTHAKYHEDASTAAASLGMSPASGSYAVSAGSTHTATVTLGNTAIYGAYLYVNGSSQWYSGSPSLTSLSMSYTFPSDASGSYTVSALVYAYNAAGTSYGSSSTYSYKVTVDSGSTPTTPTSTTPTPPSTPTYHACGIHETSVSGDHSLQASCSKTNSDGQACTVTSFYACQSHTCVFPAKVRCGRKVNGRRVCKTDVSSEQEHYVTCPRGHAYWKCDSDAKDHHRLRTCNHRYKSSGNKCGKRWRRCKFSPEPISGTRYSIMSPKCPTDPNGNRYCSE